MEHRVAALLAFYRLVQTERMQGIPILNPALAVEAVGFRVAEGQDGRGASMAEGVLITPWFMSLLRLPMAVEGHGGRVGRKRVHVFGTERFEFIGAHDPDVGFHEACALFSPMNAFAHQSQARETAYAVMTALTPAARAEPAAPPVPDPAMPPRRAFLLGRPGPTPGRSS